MTHQHASINRIYRCIWDAARGTWVPVSEVGSSRCKGSSSGFSALIAALKTLPALMALGWASAMAAPPAPAANTIPQGGTVVAGQAQINSNAVAARVDVVQSSQRAAIDWQSFNLGAGAEIRFQQPNASSVTLNRVLDGNASQIFGRISANGQVFLTNSAGIYFSPTASADVGALSATTHSISTADFMAGKTRFERQGATGSVINEGNLTAKLGGYIALLAPEVRNSGVILAQAGTVALAAGEAIELHFNNQGLLNRLVVTPATVKALVDNRAAVQAPDGMILLSARAVSELQASVVQHSGSLQANSLNAKGGRIVLEADHIQLNSGATISAAGATGGGTVLVGGDWQGRGDTYQAKHVNMMEGATIDASATTQGPGGRVVLWSDVKQADSLTRVDGTLRALGGAQGGKGGEIETSGHQVQVGGAKVSAAAPKGTGGLWLIDPSDSVIDASVASAYQATLNGGTSVLNEVTGDITASGVMVDKTSGGDATLTLKATGNILLTNTTFRSNGGNKLNTVLWSDSDGSGGGAIKFQSSFILSNGGHVWMGGGSGSTTFHGLTVGDGAAIGTATSPSGIRLIGSNIIPGAGNASLTGTGQAGPGGAHYGVVLEGNSQVTTTTGNITVTGQGAPSGATGDNNEGVTVKGASFFEISGANGNLTVTGTGGTGPSGNFNIGVNVTGTSRMSLLSGGTGVLSITGTGGNTGGWGNWGVLVEGNNSKIESLNSAAMVITGTAGVGTGSDGTAGQGSQGIRGHGNSFIGHADMSGNLTLRSDSMYFAADTTSVRSGGTVVIEPLTANTPINLNGSSSGLALPTSAFGTVLNPFYIENLIIGRSDGTGAITTGAITYGGFLTLRGDSASMSLGALSLSNNMLTLISNGAVTQTGALTAGPLKLQGSGSFTLTNAGNNVSTLTASSGGNNDGALSYVDSNDLTLTGSPTLSISRTGNVSISAGGNLTIADSISKPSSAADSNLVLKAGTHINVDAGKSISSVDRKLNVTLNSDSDRANADGPAGTNAGGNIYFDTGVSVLSRGGDIKLGGGDAGDASGYAIGLASAHNDRGVYLKGVTLDAAGGNISIKGQGSSSTGEGILIQQPNQNTIATSGTGTITLDGIGGPAGTPPSWVTGVALERTVVQSGSGAISITGQGGNYGSGTPVNVAGVRFIGGPNSSVVSQSGAISIAGIHGTLGASGNGYGIEMLSDTFIGNGPGKSGSPNVTGSSSNITLQADDISMTNGSRLASTGSLTVKPWTASTPIGVAGGAGTLSLPASYFSSNFSDGFSGITVGRSDGTGAIAANALSVNDSLALVTGNANISIAALNTNGNDLTLQSGGAVTQSGALTVAGLELKGAGSFTLTNAANNASTLAAGTGAGAISYVDSNALTVGTVNSVGITRSGTVAVSTLNGNLALTQAISTSDTSNSAVVLNAGSQAAAGSATGGDITASGAGSVSVGAGGRATLYSGSASGSTGLSGVVGAGSGRFRYNSDETTTNFTGPLGSGVNGVFREAPTVNVSADSVTAVYGSNADVNLVISGLRNGDTLNQAVSGGASLSISGARSSSGRYAVGEHSVNVSGGATSPLGYTVSYGGGSLTVTPASVGLVGGVTVANKVYDGNTNASISPGPATLSGVLAGDTVIGTAVTGRFADKNAGTGKNVLISGLTLSGADAGNYTVVGATTNAKADISKANLSEVSGLGALNKVYDGNNQAQLDSRQAQFKGMVAGDQLSVAAASASFADKNAGTAKTVSLSGITLSGADAGNYTLQTTSTTVQADITPAPLTLTGVTASSKVYDGSTAATLDSRQAALSGLVKGDVVGLQSLSGRFADKHVGTAKTVSFDGVSLNGADAGNYRLTQSSVSTVADITPATISAISGIQALDKTYDGNTSAQLNSSGATFKGQVAGDKLTVASANAQFANKNAGADKAVAISGLSLGGEDARNYVLADTNAQSSASIKKAELGSLSGIGLSDKVYDGGTQAQVNLSGARIGGQVAGDDLKLSSAQAQFSDKNAGQGKTVLLKDISLSGADAGNYQLPAQVIAGTANITPATISEVQSITAVSKPRDGNANATLQLDQAQFLGQIKGDQLSVAQAKGQFADALPGAQKTVLIEGIQLGGADAGNYRLLKTSASTQADIFADPVPPQPTLPKVNPPAAVPSLNVGSQAIAGLSEWTSAAAPAAIQVALNRTPTAGASGEVSVAVPRSIASGGSFSFALPEALQQSIASSGARPQASGLNGDALSGWLRFNADTLSFTASNVPAGALPYRAVITVGGQRIEVEITEQSR